MRPPLVSLLPSLAYYPAFEGSCPDRDSADVGKLPFISQEQKAVETKQRKWGCLGGNMQSEQALQTQIFSEEPPDLHHK